MAGLVMPWMLSRKTLRWRLAPPLPRPLPPLPRPDIVESFESRTKSSYASRPVGGFREGSDHFNKSNTRIKTIWPLIGGRSNDLLGTAFVGLGVKTVDWLISGFGRSDTFLNLFRDG
jgi:hypothetical protein